MTECTVRRNDGKKEIVARINNLPSIVVAAIISFHNANSRVHTGRLTHGPKDNSDTTITFEDKHGNALEKVTIRPGETVNDLRGEYNVVHHEYRE